jgi:hypothetical protein
VGIFIAAVQMGFAQVQSPDWPASLQLVPTNALPTHGNFYFAQNYGTIHTTDFISSFGPPFPGIPRSAAGLPLYRLADSDSYIIDDLGVNYAAAAQAMAFASGSLRAGGLAVDDFSQPPPTEDLSSSTNLWLGINSLSNGQVSLNLNNATNVVYEILTKTDRLQTNWNIEWPVFPGTNQATMPFTLPQNGRTNLFVWAWDWTGVTEGNNTVPDWWLWENFGTVAGLSDSNLDSGDVNTLLYDYQHGVDPNTIDFGVQFNNLRVNTSYATATFQVYSGIPAQMAVLTNNANFATANWVAYNSNVTVYLGPNDGQQNFWFGLKGRTNGCLAWSEIPLTRDTVPPVLVITNPTATTVCLPVIQLQGYCVKPLVSLLYSITNAAGQLTNMQGYITQQSYDPVLHIFPLTPTARLPSRNLTRKLSGTSMITSSRSCETSLYSNDSSCVARTFSRPRRAPCHPAI